MFSHHILGAMYGVKYVVVMADGLFSLMKILYVMSIMVMRTHFMPYHNVTMGSCIEYKTLAVNVLIISQ